MNAVVQTRGKKLNLTTHEYAEWEANGLSFKQNLKRKVKAMKASIKARRNISDSDYRALLKDREHRLRVIQLARPILQDSQKLTRIGANEEMQERLFGGMKTMPELNDGLESALEALDVLLKGVFEHGMSRQEFRRQTSGFSFGMSSFDKSEFVIDWVIWVVTPYIESLARNFGFARAGTLNEGQMLALVEAVDKGYVFYGPRPGRPGYQWRVTREQADRMKRAFPNIAQFIEEGVY